MHQPPLGPIVAFQGGQDLALELQQFFADAMLHHAVVIGNHFYEKAPNERGDAFTKGAREAAEKHKISLVTTLDLFNALLLLDKKKISQKEIQTKILESVGLCRL